MDFGSPVPSAAIYGSAGPELLPEEREFFRDIQPLGFILFGRNCVTPDQVRSLVQGFRETVGRPDAPVLIDQEGGRVARLGPPHWRAAPAMGRFGATARRAPGQAVEAARLNARMLAQELLHLGVTVNCAPVLDLPVSGADDVIGDRALDPDPHVAGILGRAVCEGLLGGGVVPVIKHIPGHGRATADSHKALPRVTCSQAELRETDFVPFRRLADMPWAMTAHVLYTALDPDNPATVSVAVIDGIIRGEIGFRGLLLSDDLSMQALSGGIGDRATAALAAGCDVVLHCNGDMAEMAAVAAAVGPMTDDSLDRLERGEAMRDIAPDSIDMIAAEQRLDALLGNT